MLQISKTISDFRYVLCPRRMKDEKFWRIYFSLADSHLRAAYTKAMAEDAEETRRASEEEDEKAGAAGAAASIELASRIDTYGGPAGGSTAEGGEGDGEEDAQAEGTSALDEDEDLESYLMGVLKSTEDTSSGTNNEDEGGSGEDVGAAADEFSAEDFDQLIAEDFDGVLELKSDDGDSS